MKTFVLVFVAMIAMASVARAQNCAGWSPIGDPAARGGASLAFDAARNTVVMFGGSNTSGISMGGYSSETWEYDGQRWTFRTLEGPFRTSGARIAYDAARQRTVVTGGFWVNMMGGPANTRDTWEWDGSSWTNRGLAPASFGAQNFVMDYLPGVGVVAFVSSASLNVTEIYVWDGSVWTLLPQQLPYFTGPSCTFDATRAKIVLQCNLGTFTWDGVDFVQIAAAIASPFPRSIRYVPATGKVIGFRFPATGGSPLILELRDTGWNQIGTLVGGALVDPVGSAALPDGTLLIIGNTSASNPRLIGWRFDGTTLTGVERRGPIGTEGPAMAFDPERGVSVAFGGRYGTSLTYDTETWELRGETWKRRATTGPLGRFDGSMAYDPVSHTCMLRGGTSSAGVQTWSWNGQGWTDLGGTGPTGDGTMTWDSGLNQLVYHDNEGRPHHWDGTTWVAFSPYGFNVGSNCGFAYDAGRGQFIAVGLSGGGTYRWNGAAWSRFINNTQTSNWQPNTLYSTRLGGVLLFGGFLGVGNDGNYPNRTYFLGSGATSWTDLNIRGPFGRKYSGFVDDTVAERIVMYAGLGERNPTDTWKYASGPAAVAVEPQPAGAPQGAAAELFIVAKGGGVISYQWRRHGQPLVDGGRISGARTDTLVIADLESTDAGEYDVVVLNPCGSDTSAAVRLSVLCQADFNGDGDLGTDADIEAFFACLAGSCCATCGSSDFNGDGDFGTDGDIESFFRVLGGGAC